MVAALGDFVIVALVVPESAASPGFPWDPVTSSDVNVLRPMEECADGPSVASHGLPTRYSTFQALGLGTTMLTAEISPEWRNARLGGILTPLPPIRIEVDVR